MYPTNEWLDKEFSDAKWTLERFIEGLILSRQQIDWFKETGEIFISPLHYHIYKVYPNRKKWTA